MTSLERLTRIVWLVVAGFVIAVLYHTFQVYVLGHTHYPLSTFLYNPGARRLDFTEIHEATRSLNPFQQSLLPYLPFAYIAMIPFALVKGYPGYLVFAAFFLGFLLWFLLKQLAWAPLRGRVVSALVLTFLAYPVLFTLDRGNNEACVFVFVALFFLALVRERPKWAAVFLAAATAIKIFPALFGLIFLARRQFRAVAVMGLSTLFFIVIGLSVFGPGLLQNSVALKSHLGLFHQVAFSDHSLLHSSSLFGFLRILLSLGIGGMVPGRVDVLQTLLSFYYGLILILAIGLFVWVCFFEKVLWRQSTLVVCAILLFPTISYDYKLIHVFFPLLLFVGKPKSGAFDPLVCGLFGLILIPKAYWNFYGEITASSFINPALLIVLAVVVLVSTPRRLSIQFDSV